jgi:ATP-binding cassette subfamily B (MDR/TAP) protein 1
VYKATISSFVHAPDLAGALSSVVAFLTISLGALAYVGSRLERPASDMEGKAAAFVEEMISSVRVIQSFGIGSKLCDHLELTLLKPLQELGAKRSVIRSLERSLVYVALFLAYSLAFWYGGLRIERHGLEVGNAWIVSVLTC